jgi:hypothetical protein
MKLKFEIELNQTIYTGNFSVNFDETIEVESVNYWNEILGENRPVDDEKLLSAIADVIEDEYPDDLYEMREEISFERDIARGEDLMDRMKEGDY